MAGMQSRKRMFCFKYGKTITWFIVKDCKMIKKWDDHFPGENSHLKAEQNTTQFQNTALFVHSCILNRIFVVKVVTVPCQ